VIQPCVLALSVTVSVTLGSGVVGVIVCTVPPPPTLKKISSLPAPAAQSPAVTSVFWLALTIASRSVHSPSPATKVSAAESTVIVDRTAVVRMRIFPSGEIHR